MGVAMRHNLVGILQSSKIEGIIRSMYPPAQGGVVLAAVHAPRSAWLEEPPPDGLGALGWDELEDGLTTSRRSVLATEGHVSRERPRPAVSGTVGWGLETPTA